MMAQQRVASFTLSAPGLPAHELHTSCEPCAMCLGATLWSGVKRVVYAAGRADASRLDFEEGPVFPESYKVPRGPRDRDRTLASCGTRRPRCSSSIGRGRERSTTADPFLRLAQDRRCAQGDFGFVILACRRAGGQVGT